MKTLITTLALALLAAGALDAAQRSWTGGNSTDGNWSHADNWNTLPTNGDSLLFDGAKVYASANVNDLPAGMQFSGIEFIGAIFNLGTGGSPGNLIKLNGPILRNSGASANIYLPIELLSDTDITVEGNRNLEIFGNITGASKIIKDGTGSLTLNGDKNFTGGITLEEGTLLSRGSSQSLGPGLLTINGGTVDIFRTDTTVTGGLAGSGGNITSGTADRTFTVNSTASTTYAGVLKDGATKWLAFTKNGSGTLTLTGTNTYTGATTIKGGTLLINGALGNTAVTVGTGGTLGGDGTIGGNTVVEGTLSPGNSPGELTFSGDLTLNGTATYRFEGGDLVTVGGQLDLEDGWTLALQTGFQDGGSVTLFNYGTLGGSPALDPGVTMTIDATGLGFTPTGPLTLEDNGSGQILLHGLSIIPEPAIPLLLGLSLAGLLLSRRRKS